MCLEGLKIFRFGAFTKRQTCFADLRKQHTNAGLLCNSHTLSIVDLITFLVTNIFPFQGPKGPCESMIFFFPRRGISYLVDG